VIRDADDTDSLRDALIENIHRADLGPLELAEAFAELLEDLGVTQENLAERLGVSRPHIANTIRLLQLAPDVQHLLSEGKLTAGHGRALLGLDDGDAQVSLGLRAAAEDLSVREVEELVRTYSQVPERAATATPAAKPRAVDNAQFGEAIEILSEQLQTRVQIKMGKRRGKIIVEFASTDDLERIIEEIIGSGKVHVESS
jgi:ParB family chromosome partitioning protein